MSNEAVLIWAAFAVFVVFHLWYLLLEGDMEKGLIELFANWQTAVFLIGVFMITYTIRTVVEGIWIGAKTNRFWTKIFLPLGPIATGVLFAIFAKKFPWPMPFGDSMSVKFMYGGGCGLFCNFFYARVRDWVRGPILPAPPGGSSLPPPPPEQG